jgi:preprotein translocase subunit SecG
MPDMETPMLLVITLVVHLLLAISMVIAILLQRSEGGALGIGGGGGGGGGGGFMTGRGASSALTKFTAGAATLFFITSLSLAIMSGGNTEVRSIMDAPAPASDTSPVLPSVPLPQ